MRLLVRLVVGLIGALATLIGAAALAARYWPGSTEVTVAVIAASPVLFVACVLLAVVCLLAIRAWLRLVVVALVIAAGVAVYGPMFRAEGPPPGTELQVLTANLGLGRADIGGLASIVRERDVSVLAVQEVTEESAAAIAASSIAADLQYGFVRAREGANGTALYSRFPLTSQAAIPGFTLEGVTAIAAVPQLGEVQLFALHPIPPTDPQVWERELRQVGSLLQGVPGGRPVIALGDYNSTVEHVQFRRLLTGGYANAADLAGAGWLPTYPSDRWYPALVGIDHVVIRGLGASATETVDLSGTDHRAVLATVG